MNKIAIMSIVRAHDWAAELAIVARNGQIGETGGC